jgi:hypothetical protein
MSVYYTFSSTKKTQSKFVLVASEWRCLGPAQWLAGSVIMLLTKLHLGAGVIPRPCILCCRELLGLHHHVAGFRLLGVVASAPQNGGCCYRIELYLLCSLPMMCWAAAWELQLVHHQVDLGL